MAPVGVMLATLRVDGVTQVGGGAASTEMSSKPIMAHQPLEREAEKRKRTVSLR